MLRQQAQPFVQNILRGVYVSVVVFTALWADPLSYSKVFRSWPLSTADGTVLAGRIETIYYYQRFVLPLCLVGKLPPELAP